MSLVDNFDSYTDGNLAGQGSWTDPEGYSSGDFDVQGTTVQGGTKAVAAVITGSGATVTKAHLYRLESITICEVNIRILPLSGWIMPRVSRILLEKMHRD